MEKTLKASFWRARWYLALLVALCLLGACTAGSLRPVASPTQAVTLPQNSSVTHFFQSPRVTQTPFQPLLDAKPSSTLPPSPIPPTQTSTGPLYPFDVDFGSQEKRVSIRIFPPDRRVNGGKTILLSFIPGQQCSFGDHHACVVTFQSNGGGEITFVTIHSGVGGEGQAYRHAVEGTGLNQAGLPLQKVRRNLKALAGAGVALSQGKAVFRGYTLLAAVRVPARQLDEYFDLPVTEALDLAASTDRAFREALQSGKPLLIFETCGWKMPGEPWAGGVTSTTGSIYLGVIQGKH